MDETDDVDECYDVATLLQERNYYIQQVKILKAQLSQAGITPFSSQTKSVPNLSSTKRCSLPSCPSESEKVLVPKRYSSCDEKSTSENRKSLCTYDKRSGTNDLGKQYEYVMCGFYAVRFAISLDVRDFEMTTNDEIYGDFDDIALKVHYFDGTSHTYLLQLKHTENKKNLTEKILVTEKKDYSLLKYLKTYQNLTERSNLSCILFTNRVALLKEASQFTLNNIEIIVKNFEDVTTEELLNTNENSKDSVFQFTTLTDDLDVSSFLKNFYLFTNQSNVSKIKSQINRLLGNILQSDIYDMFINFMKNWWGGNFVLTKGDVIAKLAELALSPFIVPVSSAKQTDHTYVVKDAILQFDLTLVKNGDGEIVSKIWDGTADAREVNLTSLKYGVVNKGANLEALNAEQRSKVLWYLNKVPLVVRVYDSRREQVKSAINVLEMGTTKRKVVLVGSFSKEEFPKWEVFESLYDLAETDLIEGDVNDNAEISSLRKEHPIEGNLRKNDTLHVFGKIDHTKNNLSKQDITTLQTKNLLYKNDISINSLTNGDPTNDNIKIELSNNNLLEYTKFRKDDVAEHNLIKDGLQKEEKFSITNYCSTNFDLRKENPNYGLEKYDLTKDDLASPDQGHDSTISNSEKYVISNKEFTENDELINLESTKNTVANNVYINSGQDYLANSNLNTNLVNDKLIKNILRKENSTDNEWKNDHKVKINLVTDKMDENEQNSLTSNELSKAELPIAYTAGDDLKKCNQTNDNFANYDCTKISEANDGLIKNTNKNKKNKNLVENEQVNSISEKVYPTKVDVVSIKALKKELYNVILKTFKISLQGRHPIPLEILIKTSSTAKIIKIRELLQMTQNPLHIGNKKQELPESYIPRTVTTTLLNTEKVLLHAISCNQLVIINVSPEIRVFLQDRNFNFKDLEEYTGDPETTILLTKNCTKNIFDIVCRKTPKLRVHVLEPLDYTTSILVFSSDNTLPEDVKEEKPSIQETDIHQVFNTPINVLCAQPGIGKSTMIKFLDNTCPQDYWSVRVNLRKFNSLLKDEPEEEEILLHFLGLSETKRTLLEEIKALFLQSRKIYLFLDGLDEIESNCVDFALDYVNYIVATGVHVWISSRPNLQEVITTRLNVFSIDIMELNQLQQKTYIKERLQSCYSSEEIAEVCEQIFRSADVTNSQNMLGTPLQLYVITENFLNDTQLYHRLSKEVFVLTKMYKLFFDGKKKHLYEKVGVRYDQQLGFSFNLYLENYELPGLKSCLNDDTFQKLDLDDTKSIEFLEILKHEGDKFGIVSQVNDERAVFTHQTYAEYFACLWLKKNFSKVRVLKDEFKSEKFQNLRLIFDIMLAEDSPLHLAVIYQSCEQMTRNLADAARKDKGGRLPLHLLCSYGHKYTSLQLTSSLYSNYLFHEENHIGGECIKYMEIFSALSATRNFETDDIFRWTPLDYAFHFQCLFPVETFLQLYGDKIKVDGLFANIDSVSLMYYAAKFAYPCLLNAVIKRQRNVVHVRVGETEMSFLHVAVKEEAFRRWSPDTIKVIHILVASGINVNVKDKNGATPLHWAVAQGRYEVVKALLDEAAAVNVVDNKEETVIHYALHEWEHQLKLFNDTPKDSNGGTLLHCACHEGDYDLVNTLSKDTNAVNNLLETPLHHAVRAWKPNLQIINFLLDNGMNVNSEDSFGTTPLHWAFYHGHYDVIKVLHQRGADVTTITPQHKEILRNCYKPLKPNLRILEMLMDYGFNVNVTTTTGKRILHWAAEKGHVEVVKMLITNGANVNCTSCNEETVLHAVSRGCNAKLVKMFTDIGGDVNAKDGDGITPLHRAAERGHLEMVKALLEEGANFALTTNHGEDALTFAVKSSSLDLVLLLIQRGINVNNKDIEGVAVLHWACERGNIQIVKMLLDEGANINATTNKQETPLHFAASNCNIITLLLQRGAQVNASTVTGMTPLHQAAERGQCEIVQALLQAGADVNATTTKKETVLIHAVKQRKVSVEVVRLLLAAMCDPTSTDKHGMNALHWACGGGHYDVVKLLIQKINVKTCSNNNETSLHYAAKSWTPNIEVIKRLVTAGVDINSRDNDGATALHRAGKEGDYSNVEILLELGADPQCVTTDRETVLHFAAKAWKINDIVLELLLDKGVDVNSVNNEGKSALHFASEKGFYDNVKMLLDKGALLDAVTNANLTALHFAVYGGHVKIIKLLLQQGLNVDKVETKNVVLPLYFAIRNGNLKEELLVVMAATIRDKFPLNSWKRYSHQEVITYLQEVQPYMARIPTMKNAGTNMSRTQHSSSFLQELRESVIENVGSSMTWLRDVFQILICRKALNEHRTATFIVHYPVLPTDEVTKSCHNTN